MRTTDIKYQETILSGRGTTTVCGQALWHPTVDEWNPCYTDILQPFNSYKYTCPRPPISLGRFNTATAKTCPNVLRMLIKLGDSYTIYLPEELEPLKEDILRLMNYDRYIMGDVWKSMFVHITIDNKVVQPKETHRYPGYHGDGLQGAKFREKDLCEHSYIVVDREPTVFALQPFFVAHLNDARYNIFKEFDRQITPGTPLFRTLPNHVYLIDPYMVHCSPFMQETGSRTFIRITTTPEELLVPKNTVNPMLGNQNYQPRLDVRDFVSTPDLEIPYDHYGLVRDEGGKVGNAIWCPRCGGSEQIVDMEVKWTTHSNDPMDIGNTATLSEYQCLYCQGSSFWL